MVSILLMFAILSFMFYIIVNKLTTIRNEYVEKYEEKKEHLKTHLTPKEESVIKMSGKLRSCKLDTSKVQEVCDEIGLKNPLDPSYENRSMLESVTALERSFVGMLDKMDELEEELKEIRVQHDLVEKETDFLQELMSEFSDPDLILKRDQEMAELSRKVLQLENSMKSKYK